MPKKQYGSPDQYERKLAKVMERLQIKEYNFNWDRWGCWVEFRYRGELYRFEHSIEKAKARGINLVYGSDSFAQVVLALEDLARMVERGIYELSTWVAGMKYLPRTKISEGCKNCWAEGMNRRFGNSKIFDAAPTEFVLDQKQLEKPLHWKKPRRIFVQSMGDLFHEDVPFRLIQTILDVVWANPRHTWMILTKRPNRMLQYVKWSKALNDWGNMPNVMLGVTAENQARADERIPVLLQIPAAKRFVSVEPMLGPVDLNQIIVPGDNPMEYHVSALHEQYDDCLYDSPVQLDLVICGCESGPKRRSIDINCIRDLRDQCSAAGVNFFLKQMDVDGKLVKMPELDGRVWSEVPEVRA